MTKIEMRCNSWGKWEAKAGDYVVSDLDREAALLKLLALMEVEVVCSGTHWVNGKHTDWSVSNVRGVGGR